MNQECAGVNAAELEAGARQALPESVLAALETMFCETGELMEGGRPPMAHPIRASVGFRGLVSGTFWLDIELDAASRLAANFLGLDPGEVRTRQAEMAACELANIVCGSMLSRAEQAYEFELLPPVLTQADKPATGVVAMLRLDDGGWVVAGLSRAEN